MLHFSPTSIVMYLLPSTK